jgi:hypothetical protein
MLAVTEKFTTVPAVAKGGVPVIFPFVVSIASQAGNPTAA